MINVSDAFKQKLHDGEKVWQEAEITFPDGTVKTVKNEIMGKNCTFSDCAESSSFPIGCVVCKSMTLELDNTSDQWKNYNFYMAKVHAYLKMQTSVASPAVTDEFLDENYEPILDQSGGTILATKAATEDRIETIDKGVYTITTPEQYGEILSFTALDDMYKANATYTSNLTLPQSAETLVRDACKTLGIPFDGTMQHGNLVVSELPESMTFRQLFGWVAMLETANVRLDNRGYLRFIRWDFSNVQEDYGAIADADGNITFKGSASIDSDNFISPAGNWTIDNDGFLTLIESAIDTSEKLKDFFTSPTVSSDDIIITGIKLKNRENESMYGSTGYVLELENDLVADSDLETVAAQIGDSIIGVKFRNMSGELAFNPLIEFGDMAYTYDRRWNRYVTPLTDVSYSVNGKTAVKTQADDPIRGMSKFVSDGTKAIVEARRLAKKEQSAREEAVKKLEETLKNSSGLYETSVTQEDGSTITYLHDKPTLAESKNVIKFTAESIGVSNDGGKTYPYGFFLTGDLIAKILYAHGINADYIDTGRLEVKDKDGNTIFLADMDTAQVIISGDCVKIGNKTATQAIQDVLDNTEKAIVLTMSLDNEYQGIPTDHEGNYEKFPDVQTKATVMYGHTDVTADCTYSVSKSTGVEGTWDADNKVLTVTSLQSDSGWVDISATYIQLITVTKRFNISKVKNGADGRIFFIESNTSVIKQGKDHTTPPEIVANAYYRDGLSAERTIYKGRFVVEETSDGKIWNTIYTSSEDETTITHYLYAFLDDGDGNIVTDEERNAIAFVRDDIQQVRISLYAAGATATLLDRQTYVVILDVDSLTHEEIFNLLTNNGAVKVLYKIGNQMFFSFDYARGGELVLGGKNNGNGILRVLDENDTEIGKISRNGMALYRKVTIDNMDYDIEIDTVKSLVRTSFPNVFGEGRGYAQLQGNSCSAEIGDFDEINSSGEANLSGINNLDGTTNISGNNSLDGTTELKGTTNIYDLSIYSSGSYLRLAPDGKKIAYSSSSSKRYKKHMGYVTVEQAEGLYEIPVVWFQYKNGYLGEGDYLEGKDIPGLYAEDVSAFLPEAASIHMKKKDDSGTPTDEWQIEDWDMKTVIPLIIKLLQDQKEKIDKLTERVTTLEGGI